MTSQRGVSDITASLLDNNVGAHGGVAFVSQSDFILRTPTLKPDISTPTRRREAGSTIGVFRTETFFKITHIEIIADFRSPADPRLSCNREDASFLRFDSRTFVSVILGRNINAPFL